MELPRALHSALHHVTDSDVRRRLHGVAADDQLDDGADCAIEIWRRTPGDVWLGLTGSPQGGSRLKAGHPVLPGPDGERRA